MIDGAHLVHFNLSRLQLNEDELSSKWFIIENPMNKWDDLGGGFPLSIIFGNTHIYHTGKKCG